MSTSVHQKIAEELGVRERQVQVAVELLDGGATVPFIARYRKEATGTLDDAQLRTLEERLRYLREMDERRAAILESIDSQGKLDDALRAQVMAADTKSRLEDIYLPYKPKRRTKAQIAREAGLEPLADQLLADPSLDPHAAASPFVKEDLDAAAALEGARAILVERFAEDADLIGDLRERLWTKGRMVARVRDGKEEAGAKFSDYFDFAEPLTRLPSHRILALYRGEKEEILELTLAPEEEDGEVTSYERAIAHRFEVPLSSRWLAEAVRWAWRTRIIVRLDLDLRLRLRQEAEDEAVRVFAANLRDLLLAAPAGTRTTMGLDPGFRTGVKVAIVDSTGKVVATDTIYPHKPQGRWDEALATLGKLAKQHNVDLISIGNGTASRETDQLAADLIKLLPQLTKIMVSEAGASVYSASAFASQELPGMDVSLRGAVSIARRLQDPLAELVKIDPKSIGVGQYQHDISEAKLSRSLDAVVEDCVNAVGVDVNTASAPLLTRVSGIGSGLAENIVLHRDANGPFRSRTALKEVPRLGPKAYEQCAGFLRIQGGADPLDASSVHPEAYPVVHRIFKSTGLGDDVSALIGNSSALRAVKPQEFVDGAFGLPTITDILKELDKPGRDPRPAFKTATFKEGVDKIADLEPGMLLEGVVTNVAAFGAFVDVGVHQDGLVHVSAMSKTFVKDPRDIVKPGDIVRVKVLDVDIPRARISLTLRLEDETDRRGGGGGREGGRREGGGGGGREGGRRQGGGSGGGGGQRGGGKRPPRPRQGDSGSGGGGALADALRRAGLDKGLPGS
ncbi:Tex family protein [Actinomadura sp. DC4]|uniref:Tex family protein n=1 Tax=Actinomadura sp. DC4 TaxID=3055069 RepID=UPI0025B094B1|nr:Tex family protein [Actinomadura sp. DC4]MDN3351826.1 Tex family protein [Actinomadura sp. DC4]